MRERSCVQTPDRMIPADPVDRDSQPGGAEQAESGPAHRHVATGGPIPRQQASPNTITTEEEVRREAGGEEALIPGPPARSGALTKKEFPFSWKHFGQIKEVTVKDDPPKDAGKPAK